MSFAERTKNQMKQKQCIDMIKAPVITVKMVNDISSSLKYIGRMLKKLKLTEELNHNVLFDESMKEILEVLRKRKEESKDGFIVKITDDYWDLLLCGTEVIGSCQNVSADCGTNKCLLGYVMDGKNMLVVVKDPSDKIVARSVLRFLFDEDDNPALLMERMYHSELGCAEALVKMAKSRAEELGLPLLSKSGIEPYGKKIRSLGSTAPFEYCDAVGSITNGVYEITDVKIIP